MDKKLITSVIDCDIDLSTTRDDPHRVKRPNEWMALRGVRASILPASARLSNETRVSLHCKRNKALVIVSEIRIRRRLVDSDALSVEA